MHATLTGNIKPATLLSACSVGTVIAGFSFQLVLAAIFGTGPEMDGYMAGSAPPMFLATVFATAILVTLVPALTRTKVDAGLAEAAQVANALLNQSLLILGPIALALFLSAGPLVSMLFPGLTSKGSAAAVTTLQWLSPTIVMNAIYTVLSGWHQSEKRFLLIGIAPLLSWSTSLLLVLSAPEPNVVTVAIASLIGTTVQVTLLALSFGRHRNYNLRVGVTNPRLTLMWRAAMPLLIAALFYKSGVIFERYLASTMDVGSIAALAYAQKILEKLLLVVSGPLLTVLLPQMSAHSALRSRKHLAETVSFGIRAGTWVTAPIAVVLYLAATPLASLIFERGAFTRASTEMVAASILVYLPWFWANAMAGHCTAALYAQGRTAIVALVGTCGMIAYVALAYLLVPLVGFLGLPAALSITALTNLVVFLVVLHRSIPMPWAEIVASTSRTVGASVCAAGVLQFSAVLAPSQVDVLARTLVAVTSASIAYLALSAVLWKSEARRSALVILDRVSAWRTSGKFDPMGRGR